jgi:carbonic anhydrase
MTTTIDTLVARNDDFAAQRFRGGLSLMPSLKAIVVGCADPRVDPAQVLGLDLGEAAIIRNLGGRITPATLQTMAMLGLIPQVEGVAVGGGFHLIVLHHTDCGITRLVGFPDLLAQHLGVARDDLAAQAVTDPYAAVKVDVATLRANPNLRGDFLVSGLVYDVATGRIEVVVAPAPLRPAGTAARDR